MKKLLLITYYWPPSGGAGVQRCLKFVKYLRDFGWEPVVYTAANAHYPMLDESLQKDVAKDIEIIKGPIWEPYDWYRRVLGMKKGEKVQAGFLEESDKKRSRIKDMTVWIRGNLFIPDARCFWIGSSVRLLKKYLQEFPVDAIMSSGPPHTTHIIARNVKRATGLPWLADFRDPWTDIDFYDQLKLSKWADRRHRKMEQTVLKEADQLVTVSDSCAKAFVKLGAANFAVITNGYDTADFEIDRPLLSKKFTISHIGSLNKDRNIPELWEAIGDLCKEHPSLKQDLQLRFIGKTDYQVFEYLEQFGLVDNYEKIAYVPHDEVLQLSCSSQVLLLLVNRTPNAKGVLTGKLFEYLATGRPILAVGPEGGDFAGVIEEAKAGAAIDYTDQTKMKEVILAYYKAYQAGSLKVEGEGILKYSRRELTRKLVGLLDDRMTG